MGSECGCVGGYVCVWVWVGGWVYVSLRAWVRELRTHVYVDVHIRACNVRVHVGVCARARMQHAEMLSTF